VAMAHLCLISSNLDKRQQSTQVVSSQSTILRSASINQVTRSRAHKAATKKWSPTSQIKSGVCQIIPPQSL